METRTQNGGVGSSLSGGLLRAGGGAGGGGDRPPVGVPPHESPVLSLDQIRSVRTSNEYTEGPSVAPLRPQSRQGKLETGPSQGTAAPHAVSGLLSDRTPELQQRVPLRASTYPQPTMTTVTHMAPGDRGLGHSTSVDGSHAPSIRTSTGSSSSEQRLLGGSPVTPERVVRVQPPKRPEVKSEDLKPLSFTLLDGGGEGDKGEVCECLAGKRCEDCGRCQCKDCRQPRHLPVCWLCGQRCLCSAESAVEYGTCVCCVKGLFYHCSTDDEDTCADKPFSCSQAHRCARWSALGALTFLLPCLLCYLPAKGCLALCQGCYDHAKRPGCRCNGTANIVHCKDIDKPT